MGFRPDYELDRIEHVTSLDEIDNVPKTSEGYKIQDFVVPERYYPENVWGVNTGKMQFGQLDSGEWILTKPVSANYGRAGKANLMAATALDRTSLSSPDIGIDGEKIIVEYLGGLERPRMYSDDVKGMRKALAGKVITGDPDIGGNIGVTAEGNYVVYDFDQAGNPLGRAKNNLSSFLDCCNFSKDTEVSLSEVMDEAIKMVEKIDIEDYIGELNCYLDENLPGSYGFNDLDVRTVESNFRDLKEDNVLLNKEKL